MDLHHRRGRVARLARQLLLYGVFGGTGAATDLAVYLALVGSHLTPVLANVVSVCCGIAVSFVLNSRLNFRKTDRTRTRLARFFTVGLSGLALSTALLAVLTHHLDVLPAVAKLITIPPVVASQFIANRAWTFSHIEPMPDRSMATLP